MKTRGEGTLWIRLASIVAVLFGLLTIQEGGAVIFWSETARRAAGQYVPFVVWFNFLEDLPTLSLASAFGVDSVGRQLLRLRSRRQL